MSRIGLATGWEALGNYWGTDWLHAKQIGGSENLVIQLARQFARMGHDVVVRLPYGSPVLRDGVQWVGRDHPPLDLDALFAFDLFGERDRAARTALVATRSDPPAHTDFDVRIYYSRFHARAVGDAGSVAIGGGVALDDYRDPLPRIARRVICCTSPDRVPAASLIGRGFDFVHSYKPIPGLVPTVELGRAQLIRLQQTAQVMIHPLDPVRPSEMFGMALLEAMAAGTPVVTSDADAMPELWSGVALVLPRPIDYAQWDEEVEDIIEDRARWQEMSDAGRALAAQYDWPIVARKFLEVACGD